jgi:hypothetical protein
MTMTYDTSHVIGGEMEESLGRKNASIDALKEDLVLMERDG